MIDLLGDEIHAQPEASDYGFEEAWQAYPSGPRRVAKRHCRAKWIKMGLSNKAGHILAHIQHMKTEDCWLRGFVPMFATYLNQDRWEDWTPPKPVKREPDALQTILAHKGAPMPESVRERLASLRQSIRAGA